MTGFTTPNLKSRK